MSKEKHITILVTGGAGYIGSHCVLQLLQGSNGHKFEVVVVDNCCNSYCPEMDINGNKKTLPESLRRVELIANSKLKAFYKLNLHEDAHLLDQVFLEHRIQAVIHLAALKSVGESCKRPLDYFSNNVSGSINLFNTMEKFGCKNLIFSSSATVYGPPNQLPIDETHVVGKNLTNPYGTTKFIVERILEDLCKHSNDQGASSWNIIALRYFNPVGAHQSGHIGEMSQGIPNNLMPYISQVAINKREKLLVYGGDFETIDGTGIRDYIHIMDLADGHVKAIEKLFKLNEENNRGWRIYNLGTGHGTSVLQMVKAFEEATGVKIPYEIVGRRLGDIDSVYSDVSKAGTELGWVAKYDIHDMCRDTYKWQSQYPDGYKGPYRLLDSHLLEPLIARLTFARLTNARTFICSKWLFARHDLISIL